MKQYTLVIVLIGDIVTDLAIEGFHAIADLLQFCHDFLFNGAESDLLFLSSRHNLTDEALPLLDHKLVEHTKVLNDILAPRIGCICRRLARVNHLNITLLEVLFGSHAEASFGFFDHLRMCWPDTNLNDIINN